VEAGVSFNDGIAVVLFTVLLSALAKRAYLAPGADVKWAFVRLVAGGAALGAPHWRSSHLRARGFERSSGRDHPDDHCRRSIVSRRNRRMSQVMAAAPDLVIGNYGMQAAMSPGTRLAVMAFGEYAVDRQPTVFRWSGIEVAYVIRRHKIGVAVGAVVVPWEWRSSIPFLPGQTGFAGMFRSPGSIAFLAACAGAVDGSGSGTVLGIFRNGETVPPRPRRGFVYPCWGRLAPALRRLGLVGVRGAERPQAASDMVAREAAIERYPMGAARPGPYLPQRSQADRARRAALLARKESALPWSGTRRMAGRSGRRKSPTAWTRS
jgi:hypothetical protein